MLQMREAFCAASEIEHGVPQLRRPMAADNGTYSVRQVRVIFSAKFFVRVLCRVQHSNHFRHSSGNTVQLAALTKQFAQSDICTI